MRIKNKALYVKGAHWIAESDNPQVRDVAEIASMASVRLLAFMFDADVYMLAKYILSYRRNNNIT